MTADKDQLYSYTEAASGSFVFDERVAKVFADMISRSVPGYQQILEMLPTLTKQFKLENANYYDLGCSLGAGLLAIDQGLDKNSACLIGIDNSQAMLEQARINLGAAKHDFELHNEDLEQSKFENAALVLMNFTLQFITLDKREALLEKIYKGLHPGGALILSEKIRFDHQATQELMTNIHHQYKSDQGYSDLEISRKREAIEQILIPETLDQHITRLKSCGFKVITPWVQNLQFVSLLAVK